MGFNNTKALLKASSVSCAVAGAGSAATTTTVTTKRQKKRTTTRTNTTSSTSILYMTKTFVSFSIILTTLLMLHVVDAKIGNYYLVSQIFFSVFLFHLSSWKTILVRDIIGLSHVKWGYKIELLCREQFI